MDRKLVCDEESFFRTIIHLDTKERVIKTFLQERLIKSIISPGNSPNVNLKNEP